MTKKPNGAAADDEIEIIAEPAAEAPEVVIAGAEDIPPIPDPPAAEVPPEEGIEALRTKLAEAQAAQSEERARRVAAENRARDADARSATAGKEKHETELSLVSNAIETVKQSDAMLEANYAAAAADGDWSAAAKIQREMAANAAKLQVLEQGKLSLENVKEPEVRRVEADPVEALAAQLTPKSAAWVRAHPEYARDNRLYGKMLAAHNLAVADGLEADSEDYFAAVEDTLKLRKPVTETVAPESALSGAAAPAERRQAPPAAPPNGGGNGGRNVVRLSADEREMAAAMGLTDQEYARNKLDLIKEGKMQ